jgi:hypothetical protein
MPVSCSISVTHPLGSTEKPDPMKNPMPATARRFFALASLVAWFPACAGGAEDSGAASGGGAGAAGDGEGGIGGQGLKASAYVLGARVWDDTSTTSYFHVVPSIAQGTPVDVAEALEVPGSAKLFAAADIGWFGIGGGDENPTITRYTLDDEGRLEADATTISLQEYGIQGLWETLYVVSDTKMYYPDRQGQRLIVIDPSRMQVVGEIDLGETGREGFLALYSYAHLKRDTNIVFSVAWIDWNETDSIVGATGLVVLDTETDEVVRFDVDDRCGGVTQPVEVSNGDAYFASSALAATAHRLGRLPTEPCSLRVRAGDDAFDPDYLDELAAVTGSALVGEPIPAGDDSVFLRAFDEDLGTVSDDALTWELTSQSVWRWLRWTPETNEVFPLDTLEPSTSDVLWFRVDGKVYGTETTSDYSKTTLIDLGAEGGPQKLITVPGFLHGVAKVR